MPMQLTITYEQSNEGSSDRNVHCFVSLPVLVASTMNAMNPYAPLVILSIQAAPNSPPIYVAWSGSTTQEDGSLGLHPTFASMVCLEEGTTVDATVAERIINAPSFPIVSAKLRPLSYQRDDVAAANDDYRILSATAQTLQNTILTRIRVLTPSSAFPLVLPGRHPLPVLVTDIQTPHATTPPYGVLQPSSQLEIETPPSPPTEDDIHRHFARVVAISLSRFSNVPAEVLKTHALLPSVTESARVFCVTISRKRPNRPPALSIPVAARMHPNVPLRSIVLPPHVWMRLRLTPLTPVLVDPIPAPRTISSLALVADPQYVPRRKCNVEPEELASFNDFNSSSAVIFQGTCVDAGVLLTKEDISTLQEANAEHHDSWSDLPLNVDPGKLNSYEEGVIYLDDTVTSDAENEIASAALSRQLLQAYRVDSNTTVQEHLSISSFNFVRHVYPKNELIHAGKEEVLRRALLSALGPSMHTAIAKMRDTLREAFTTSKSKFDHTVVAVEGPLGSGKTTVCRAVSAILRDVAGARTIWMRGRVHGHETILTRLKRLRLAFEAAADEGAGIVIVDDFDLFCRRSDASDDKGSKHDPTAEQAEESRLIANVLESLVSRKRPYPVVFLAACDKVGDLFASILAPGFISQVVSLNMPTVDDRAFLYLRALSKTRKEGASNCVAEKAIAIAKMTDGYSFLDVDVSLRRAMLRLDQTLSTETEMTVEDLERGLIETIEDFVPIHRLGIKVREEQVGEDLSWIRIGGLAEAKAAIQEALELPSCHAHIFKNVPIRLPHGLLLYGPPGCGKTLLARTAAVESGMQCVMVKGPELMGKYVGQSEAEVRRVFERASACAPCVLLFDEFDALAPNRGGWDAGVTDRVVNTLLTCMDGVERLSEGVYIIATSSRPEVIDGALLRPGRLDRWIGVDVPEDAAERFDILKSLATGFFDMSEAVVEKLHEIAENTEGYTGADLGGIVNDAQMAVSEDHIGSNSKMTNNIVAALTEAWEKSRPSLSAWQRAHYATVMAKFASQSQGGKSREKAVQPIDNEFGKRLALQ